jgi:hypothetical protein
MIMKNVDDYLREYSNEVAALTRTYFTWKHINVTASKDKEVGAVLNSTPSTWDTIMHSLQTTMFILLGRVFDIDDEAFSIHKFVKYCSEHVEEFSWAALRQRKMNGLEKPPQWIEEYLNSAHYPQKEELLRLRGEVSKRCKIYEEKYKPIRHKLMAHKDFASIGRTDTLFAVTNIKELEEIVSFCNQIKLAIFEQYYNGRQIDLSKDILFDGEDKVVEKEIEKLLNSIRFKA